MKRRSLLTAAGLACLAPLAARAAEPFPTRPVRIIVPYAAGGGPDVFTRRMAIPLGQALGQSIVTEGDTWEELRANVREAVLCHFDEGKAPAVIRLHRVMDELVPVA